MPDIQSRADSLREYLTGALADGGSQSSNILSLGNYRSSTEVMSYGITITNPLSSISVDFASGGCASGTGTLIAADTDHVTWQDSLGSAGDLLYLPGIGSTGIVETAGNASSFLRVTRTSANSITGNASITLKSRRNNLFGLDSITSDMASAGISEYVATIIRNESLNPVQNLKRWISLLGATQVCSTGLGGSGSGTIVTNGTFVSWPNSGYCRISSGGSLKEIVYYTSRTSNTLTVILNGRGMLNTTLIAGSGNDQLDAVPGIAIGIDNSGVQAFGSPIQTIGTIINAPTGITWGYVITQLSGINFGNLNPNQQIGFWMWRQIPVGAIATPFVLDAMGESFDAY